MRHADAQRRFACARTETPPRRSPIRHQRPLILADWEREVVRLERELREGSSRPGAYFYFTITEPKERVVAAAPFRDRVVHHALVRVIEPCFEPRWIEDSYACRKGKGTHGEAAREYLRGLRLEIHPDKYRALRCAEGVDFCGFVVRADGRVPRRHQRPIIARSAAATGTTPRTTCAPRTGTTTTRRTRTTMWVSASRGP